MRTTLRIDDDVLRAAKTLARERGSSLGEVLSELARKGLRPRRQAATEGGFPVFSVGPEVPLLTPEVLDGADDDAG